MRTFYAYMYSNPETQTVFYVGKGTGRRAWAHLGTGKCHNQVLERTIAKIRRNGKEPLVTLVPAESEEHAYFLERTLIKLLGRRDLGLGTLVNFTDGGEGPSGQRFSPESIAKMSASHKGRKTTPEQRRRQSEAQTGRKASEEHKAKISAALKGKSRSPEHCAAISKAKKGRPVPAAVLAAATVANTGRKRDPDSVLRGSSKLKGRSLPEAQRQKVRDGVNAYYARVRQSSHV